MKIEKISQLEYRIFVNRGYYLDIDYNKQSDLISLVKEIVLKYKNKLNLSGFYKVKVYPIDRVGIYIDLVNMDSLEYSTNIDLRVIVYQNKKVYFETDDYFIIDKYDNIVYYNKLFYVNINKIEDINEIVDYGRFVLEDDINLNKAIVIGEL